MKHLAFAFLTAGLGLAGPAVSQDLSATLSQLQIQLDDALADEVALSRSTVNLQDYRSQGFSVLLELEQAKRALNPRSVTQDFINAEALRRYVVADLALNIADVNQQLEPLDSQRQRIAILTDNVEKTRAALLLNDGTAPDAATAAPLDLTPLPKPEGVFSERQPEFRALPVVSIMDQEKPLILPVQRATLAFGFGETDPDDPAGLFIKGVQLLTDPGVTVYAPFEGEIVYAAPYRSFGNLVVIEHDGDGATLLSGLHSFAISVGDWVGQGAPVGKMSAEAQGEHRLYFEFRMGPNPVDPLALIGSLSDG